MVSAQHQFIPARLAGRLKLDRHLDAAHVTGRRITVLMQRQMRSQQADGGDGIGIEEQQHPPLASRRCQVARSAGSLSSALQRNEREGRASSLFLQEREGPVAAPVVDDDEFEVARLEILLLQALEHPAQDGKPIARRDDYRHFYA